MPHEQVKSEDLGTKYQYFEYRDMPARKLSAEAVPEIYRASHGWEPVSSTWDFLHNYVPVDETRIKEMIAHLHS